MVTTSSPFSGRGRASHREGAGEAGREPGHPQRPAGISSPWRPPRHPGLQEACLLLGCDLPALPPLSGLGAQRLGAQRLGAAQGWSGGPGCPSDNRLHSLPPIRGPRGREPPAPTPPAGHQWPCCPCRRHNSVHSRSAWAVGSAGRPPTPAPVQLGRRRGERLSHQRGQRRTRAVTRPVTLGLREAAPAGQQDQDATRAGPGLQRVGQVTPRHEEALGGPRVLLL